MIPAASSSLCLKKLNIQPSVQKERNKKQIFKQLKRKEMKEEIRQDGRTILSSKDGFSIRKFFNNLSEKSFSGKEYRDYVRNSFWRNGSQDGHTPWTQNSTQGQKSNFVRITYKREPEAAPNKIKEWTTKKILVWTQQQQQCIRQKNISVTNRIHRSCM